MLPTYKLSYLPQHSQLRSHSNHLCTRSNNLAQCSYISRLSDNGIRCCRTHRDLGNSNMVSRDVKMLDYTKTREKLRPYTLRKLLNMLSLINMWTEHQCMLETQLYHLIKLKLLRRVQNQMSEDVTHVIRDLIIYYPSRL